MYFFLKGHCQAKNVQWNLKGRLINTYLASQKLLNCWTVLWVWLLYSKDLFVSLIHGCSSIWCTDIHLISGPCGNKSSKMFYLHHWLYLGVVKYTDMSFQHFFLSITRTGHWVEEKCKLYFTLEGKMKPHIVPLDGLF